VSPIKIYIDEDAMDSDLVSALRSHGVTVVTVLDSGPSEKTDEEQLAFATELGCVLYTFNVSDFIDFTRIGSVPGENMRA
jgi:predicted nuclease of predicted toxin-antitoxin system